MYERLTINVTHLCYGVVKPDPLEKAKLFVPIYLFLIGMVLSFITVFKGLNNFDIHLNLKQNLAVTLASSIAITALTPSRAFAATLAAATTVVLATSTGIPVFATQTLVGAVLGVGLARGIGALNLIVIRNIFMSLILTLPAASLLTILAYKVLHAVFG